MGQRFSQKNNLKDSDKIIIGGDSDKGDRFIEPTVIDFGNDWKSFTAGACTFQCFEVTLFCKNIYVLYIY